MATIGALNSETICDLEGKPIDRHYASLLKAIDKLLTVGSYYSNDHVQYQVVSEEVCAQMVEAMAGADHAAIEITAQGMMVGAQLVNPHHRNIRLLHELLVPLNIARIEFSAKLTPEDLRQAVASLQDHRRNLGNNSGFQEIVIRNLPSTVSTAARNVVAEGGGEGFSLDELLGRFDIPGSTDSGQGTETDSENLARLFLDIVNQILENLEKGQEEGPGPGLEGGGPASREDLLALKESLRKLVEINPDPGELARLIGHAKRALDLSRDPDSVDLVFSLLKKELVQGGDWKERPKKQNRNRNGMEYTLDLAELKQAVAGLETKGCSTSDPETSSLDSFLGICFHLLEGDQTEVLEIALVEDLAEILSRGDLPMAQMEMCFEAVTNSAKHNDRVALDRLLAAFCEPMRRTHPHYLAQCWERLWGSLPEDRQAWVWPHFINDLMLGFEGVPSGAVDEMWLSAGSLDPRVALKQVTRLENMPALVNKVLAPSLMNLPPEKMYSVFLALMKSSLAPMVGPRLHFLMTRMPANALTEVLLRGLGKYDPAHDGTYLAIIRNGNSSAMTPEFRKLALKMISETLAGLAPVQRTNDWAREAILWIGKLDPDAALPLLTEIRDKKKYFFFKVWPQECRLLAGKVILEMSPADAEADGGSR